MLEVRSQLAFLDSNFVNKVKPTFIHTFQGHTFEHEQFMSTNSSSSGNSTASSSCETASRGAGVLSTLTGATAGEEKSPLWQVPRPVWVTVGGALAAAVPRLVRVPVGGAAPTLRALA